MCVCAKLIILQSSACGRFLAILELKVYVTNRDVTDEKTSHLIFYV